jgi:hypothetical protein
MALIQRGNAGSCDIEERKSTQCRSLSHLRKKPNQGLKTSSHARGEREINVLLPSTISGSRSVLSKSLSTSGGHVAESAIIGTDGSN